MKIVNVDRLLDRLEPKLVSRARTAAAFYPAAGEPAVKP